MGTNGAASPGLSVKAWDEAERRAILNQLERMLATALFSHSRRYPALLRYVVEQTLAGRADQIKERTLGIEVFGRPPDYDTTLDPVVRTTAAEIRKRIAQYYHEAEQRDELRIELPAGAYVPEFQFPPGPHPPAPDPVPEAPAGSAGAASRTPARVQPAWTLRLLIFAVTLAAGVVVLTAWFKPWAFPSALDRFWAPVLDSPNPVLLCVGQPHFAVFQGVRVPVIASDESLGGSNENQVSLDELYLSGRHYVSLWDAVTSTRVAAFLEAKAKRYRIRGEMSTSLTDLRDGPAVLVGAFNNDWTLRLLAQLRYNFAVTSPHIYAIRDRQNQASESWKVDTAVPYLKQTDDYALISRIRDATTDRVVVVAAGVAFWGTIAAGEFLTDPKYMDEVARSAPRDWEHKNMQIVIGTKVIAGNSGPPHVLATYFW